MWHGVNTGAGVNPRQAAADARAGRPSSAPRPPGCARDTVLVKDAY